MGSSTASNSEATINTSTESASTLVTNVTTDTDATNDSLDIEHSGGQSEPLLSSLDETTSISSLVSPRLLKSKASDQENLIASPCTVVYYQKRSLAHHHHQASSSISDDDFIEISGLEENYSSGSPIGQNTQPSRRSSKITEISPSKITFEDVPPKRSSKINCPGKMGESSSSSSSSPSSVSANTVTLVSPSKNIEERASHSRFNSLNSAAGNGGSILSRVVLRDKFTLKKRINSAPLVTSHSGNNMKTDSTMFPFDREAIDYERIQRECFAVDETEESIRHYPFLDLDTDPDSPVYDKPGSIFHSPSKLAYGRSQCNVAHEYNEMTERYRYHYPPPPHNSNNGAEDIYRQYAFLSQQERDQSRDRRSPNMKRAKGSGGFHTDAFSPKPAKSRQSPGYVMDKPEKDESRTSENHSPSTCGGDIVVPSVLKFEQINSKFEQIPPNQRRTSYCVPTHGTKALSPTIGANQSHKRTSDSNHSPTVVRITPPLPDLKVDFYSSLQRSDDDEDLNHDDGKSRQSGRSTSQNRNNSPTDRYNSGSHHSTQTMIMSSHEANGGDDDQKRQLNRGDANLDGCQKNAYGSINVTPNPMDGPVTQQPRATTIVVQQVCFIHFNAHNMNISLVHGYTK